MLQVNYIRDNREQVLERLAVKNFKQSALVDEIIQLDDKRRQTQTSLDNALAEANTAAKKIGELMRTGEKVKADTWKVIAATKKDNIRELGEQLTSIENECKANRCCCLICRIVRYRKGLPPRRMKLCLKAALCRTCPQTHCPIGNLPPNIT
jgi:seryl-tRNA synthetase